MTTKEFLNVRDTARLLGVHENTVRNWEARGLLRAVHLPGSGFRRFAPQDRVPFTRETVALQSVLVLVALGAMIWLFAYLWVEMPWRADLVPWVKQ